MAETSKLHCLNLTTENEISSDTDYYKAITNMLRIGWSAEEINDLPISNILEFAEVKSFSKSTKYLCYYVDSNNQDKIIEISKDKFDYCTNEKKSKMQSKTNISEMSSTGKLSISDIWNSSSDLNVYNSTGYLKQDQYLTWIGNNTFYNSYRWELVILPENTKKDVFYLLHANNTTMLQNTQSYVYKYDLALNNDTIIANTYETNVPVTYQYSDNQGVIYTVDLKDPEANLASDGFCYSRYTNHRGYMSYKTMLSNTNDISTSATGGYRHCRWSFVITPSVSFNGASISISPSYAYVAETPGTYCSSIR